MTLSDPGSIVFCINDLFNYQSLLVDHMLSDERGWLCFVSIMHLIPGTSQ